MEHSTDSRFFIDSFICYSIIFILFIFSCYFIFSVSRYSNQHKPTTTTTEHPYTSTTEHPYTTTSTTEHPYTTTSTTEHPYTTTTTTEHPYTSTTEHPYTTTSTTEHPYTTTSTTEHPYTTTSTTEHPYTTTTTTEHPYTTTTTTEHPYTTTTTTEHPYTTTSTTEHPYTTTSTTEHPYTTTSTTEYPYTTTSTTEYPYTTTSTTEYPIHGNQVFQGKELLNLFNFFAAPDPTHGSVDYNAGAQNKEQLVIIEDNMLKIGTAGSNVSNEALKMDWTGNVPSIRIYTKQIFSGGLFSIQLFHVPAGNGVWPAIWFSQDPSQVLPDGTLGKWPEHGEIDLYEEVNDSDTNSTTLHICGLTSNGICPVSCQYGDQSYCEGKGCLCPSTCSGVCGDPATCPFICNPEIFGNKSELADDHCTTFGGNPGCGVISPPHSFGKTFNTFYGKNPSGAVYTMNWTYESENEFTIEFYFLTDSLVIENMDYGPFSPSPNISKWNVSPYGVFVSKTPNSKCPLYDLQMIINITLCGDWAGAVFESDTCQGSQCCNEYIQNKSNLKEAYFSIGKFSYLSP